MTKVTTVKESRCNYVTFETLNLYEFFTRSESKSAFLYMKLDNYGAVCFTLNDSYPTRVNIEATDAVVTISQVKIAWR